jgi:hypothetical protein
MPLGLPLSFMPRNKRLQQSPHRPRVGCGGLLLCSWAAQVLEGVVSVSTSMTAPPLSLTPPTSTCTHTGMEQGAWAGLHIMGGLLQLRNPQILSEQCRSWRALKPMNSKSTHHDTLTTNTSNPPGCQCHQEMSALCQPCSCSAPVASHNYVLPVFGPFRLVHTLQAAKLDMRPAACACPATYLAACVTKERQHCASLAQAVPHPLSMPQPVHRGYEVLTPQPNQATFADCSKAAATAAEAECGRTAPMGCGDSFVQRQPLGRRLQLH